MNDAEHERVTGDPVLRAQWYRPMVRRYYECVTGVYRQFWGDSYHFALYRGAQTREEALIATERLIADEGSFRPGLAILDLGCGLGGPALHIVEYAGATITGVDLCEHHLRIASERARALGLAGRLRLSVADGLNLPFFDAAFDRIYVFEAGCHIPDKGELCRECARVLRPGGEFLGLDWMQRDGLTMSEQDRFIEPICRHCSVPNMISPAMMSEHLARSGFDVLLSAQASSVESLLPNWQLPDRVMTALPPGWDLEALRRISRGGQALEEATRAGAFVIGHWHARKRP
jgi:ubiquinone/menaquinone biosynthesis C-methylase UbiE